MHRKTGARTLCAASRYSVPAKISPLLDFVAGLDRLPTIQPGLHQPFVERPIATSFTVNPELLRKLYSLPSAPATTKGNLQAVAAFNNESFLPADLRQFQAMQKLPLVLCLKRPLHGVRIKCKREGSY